ncbi:MAG: excinuclease ABC subunit UvrA [Simkaniaceae bacterium]|nr:excinuclease ABC subunit UvrA [Simkaniaceae bacterium]
MSKPPLRLKKVRVHNLKGIDLSIPSDRLVLFTGVSGSGKSSLAFDTIYIEGQRRYVESLSRHLRHYAEELPKPDLDAVEGIRPTIAVEQKTAGHNPRSTVGTMTGIYDYLRLLFAETGTCRCPLTGEVITPQSVGDIVASIERLPLRTKLTVLAPYARKRKGSVQEMADDLLREGFSRIRLNGTFIDLADGISLPERGTHDIDLVIDRLILGTGEKERLIEAVETALASGSNTLSVLYLEGKEEKELFFSLQGYAKKSKRSYPPLEAHDFSFNHPAGMCPWCKGLGYVRKFDLTAIIDENATVEEGCLKIPGRYGTVNRTNIYEHLARIYRFGMETVWKDLPEKVRKILLYGDDKDELRTHRTRPAEKGGGRPRYVPWRGILAEAEERLNKAKSAAYEKSMKRFVRESVCPECLGSRLKAYPAMTLLGGRGGKRIHEITAMTVEEALSFFTGSVLEPPKAVIAEEIIEEIKKRLRFLSGVGLHYLTLDRVAPTLSGGEGQRVRLASRIGSGLTSVIYVLDEPSIGLHPSDNAKLIRMLHTLSSSGNTVIVVEHDPETILAADHIVDFGPGAGKKGGTIVAQGTPDDIMKNPRSLTGRYLAEGGPHPHHRKRRVPSPDRKGITLRGATHHNLRNVTLTVPSGLFTAVTGVSGSGKSSLITGTLYPALAAELHGAKKGGGPYESIEGVDCVTKVIAVDQTPIGKIPGSNPGTYTKVFDEIRLWFASLPASKVAGFTPSRFSFNAKEGACPACAGTGRKGGDTDLADTAWQVCPLCSGKRFDERTLSVTFKGHTIHDVLEMTIEEAHALFDPVPAIRIKLAFLIRAGLGYLPLGQPATTLSGGEAQRIKLASELIRPAKGHTLYILDEPTTGLHPHDITTLTEILHALCDAGHSLLVIEHNTDLIKVADWVIDLGPGGGTEGGRILFAGSPDHLAEEESPTGQALRQRVVSHQPPTTGETAGEEEVIRIKGAGQNNLRNLSLSIPRNGITLFTGPSGSGKSSLAFETLYAEGQRRYIDTLPPHVRRSVRQMPKPDVDLIEGLPPSIAVKRKGRGGSFRSTVGTMTEIDELLRTLFARAGVAYCPDTHERITFVTPEYIADYVMRNKEGTPLYVLAPLTSSSTKTFGEVKDLLLKRGFLRIRLNGRYLSLDEEEISYDPKRENELFLVIDRLKVRKTSKVRIAEAVRIATAFSKEPVTLSVDGTDLLFHLSFSVPATGKCFPPLTPNTFSCNAEEGMCPLCSGSGFMEGSASVLCEACRGERLRPLARMVEVAGIRFGELVRLPLFEALAKIKEMGVREGPEWQELFLRIEERLRFLCDLGLTYLSLDRTAPTLSGGEVARIHLAGRLGRGLTGSLYVIEEPTANLHPYNTFRLGKALENVRAPGNTLIIVDHDPTLLSIADTIVEFGPEGGKGGGRILARGTLTEIKRESASLTGHYMRKGKPPPRTRRKGSSPPLIVEGAYEHNLRIPRVTFPTHAITAITGVSGAGKSTLMRDILYRRLRDPERAGEIKNGETIEEVALFDQNPTGHTPRSDVATYTGVLTPVRHFYASLKEAKIRGLTPDHFAYNTSAGMCERCRGLGIEKVHPQPLPPVTVTCNACRGNRLRPLPLTVRYKGKHPGDLLRLTISEALAFLPPVASLQRLLSSLEKTGLGYLTLGQRIATLSGGESTRLRLSSVLAKPDRKHSLYLFDEPTMGLHLSDIERLTPLFHEQIDRGNTVIMIEHNPRMIVEADHIIDLGPGAGDEGGRVIATGTPEEVAGCAGSKTAPFLKELVTVGTTSENRSAST